jgi:hypothetical protein
MKKSVPKPKIKDVLVVFINPAGVPADGEAVPEGTPTRDNQPWFVYFTSLGVTLKAVHRDGSAITGYWDTQDAGAWAQSMYSQIVADPEYLAQCRETPDTMPAVWDGYKMMSRRIPVPIQ